MTLPASKQEARQLVKEAEQKIQAGDNIGAAICYAKASYGFEHIPR